MLAMRKTRFIKFIWTQSEWARNLQIHEEESRWRRATTVNGNERKRMILSAQRMRRNYYWFSFSFTHPFYCIFTGYCTLYRLLLYVKAHFFRIYTKYKTHVYTTDYTYKRRELKFAFFPLHLFVSCSIAMSIRYGRKKFLRYVFPFDDNLFYWVIYSTRIKLSESTQNCVLPINKFFNLSWWYFVFILAFLWHSLCCCCATLSTGWSRSIH